MSNTQKEHKYKNIYDGLGDLKNPQLMQSFALNNNTDIIKGIEYWKSLKNGASEEENKKYDAIVTRFENAMLQRLNVTEDLYDELEEIAKSTPKKDSKGKKIKTVDMKGEEVKDSPETLNDILGKKEKESKEIKEEIGPVPSAYHKRYNTDDEKIDALNSVTTKIEEILQKKDGRENARKYLKWHLMNYGKNVQYSTDTKLEKFLDWIESGHFKYRSPLDVINGEPLSISDLVKETTNLVQMGEEGMSRKDVKEYIRPYALNYKLKEQENVDQMIRSEEDYDNFFQSTLEFVFSDSQREIDKQAFHSSLESREQIKETLYAKYKGAGKRAVTKMAAELHTLLAAKGEEGSIVNRVGETIKFLKNKKDTTLVELHNSMKTKSSKSKEEKGYPEKETEEPEEEEVEETKSTLKPMYPSKYPILEKDVSYLDKLSEIEEFFLKLINKKEGMIGSMTNGYAKQEEALAHLAKKRLLQEGIKETEDWTEQDVSEWLSRHIRPFATEEYSLLRAANEKEAKEILKDVYLANYPAGKEKERTEKIKEVLTSEIPRSAFAKAIAKKVRKNNLRQINAYFTELNQEFLAEEKAKLEEDKYEEKGELETT